MMTHALLAALTIATTFGAMGCASSTEEPEPSGSGGAGQSQDLECGSDLEITVTAGTGIGTGFVPLEEGDPLVPYFGSQIGMEVALSARVTGLSRGDVNDIFVSLNVDDAPIGYDTFSPRDLYCEDDTATIDTPVLIDVSEHPTVTSVAQLNGREAEVVLTLQTDLGEQETRVPVTIQLD